MNEVWVRIETWLKAHARPVAAGLNPPATNQEVTETESFLGVRFPDEFRAAYLRHNGQSPQSPGLMNGWDWLPLKGIRNEWGCWKDLLDRGTFEGWDCQADGIMVRREWWNPGWISIAASGSGDSLCLDLAPGPSGTIGQIITMFHDDGIRPVEATSFRAWLAAFADGLEADEYELSDEYGGLIRREEL